MKSQAKNVNKITHPTPGPSPKGWGWGVVAEGALLLLFLFLFLAPTITHAGILSKAPNNLGLVGYWPMNEGVGTTAGDMSGSGNTGTLTSMDPATDWVAGKRGKALDFDGVNDYVITGNVDIAEKDNGVTAGAWIYVSSIPVTQTVVAHGGGNWSPYSMWGLSIGASRQLFLQTISLSFTGGDGYKYISSASDVIPLNTWAHVAMVLWYDAGENITYMRGYVNGNVVISQDFSGEYLCNITSRPFIVGALTSSSYPTNPPANFFNGLIDDVRIYNRALSASEVTKLYQSGSVNVKAPNNLGLVGHWSMNEGAGTKAGDSSGNGNTGTLTSMDPATDWVAGKRGKALDFDGSNDYVDAGDDESLDVTDAITITAWVKTPDLPNFRKIVSKGDWEAFTGYALDFDSAGKVRMLIGNSTYIFNATSLNSYDNDAWHHVVGRWGGGEIELFVDGEEVKYTGQQSVLSIDSSIRHVDIGRYHGGNYFNGQIDDVRIYNRALSADEISALYHQGEAMINAPQNDKLTDGLVGLWSFNGKDISGATAYDRSPAGGNNGTISGAVPAIGKVGQALSFNGAGDYINLPDSSSLGGLNDNVTVSAWAYRNSASQGVITSQRGVDWTSGFTLRADADGTIGFYINGVGSYKAIANTKLSLNKWEHVTGVYDGSKIKIYVNGVLDGTPYDYAGPLKATLGRGGKIGSDNDDDTRFNGLIDEVRIYNRALTPSEVKQLYNMGK